MSRICLGLRKKNHEFILHHRGNHRASQKNRFHEPGRREQHDCCSMQRELPEGRAQSGEERKSTGELSKRAPERKLERHWEGGHSVLLLPNIVRPARACLVASPCCVDVNEFSVSSHFYPKTRPVNFTGLKIISQENFTKQIFPSVISSGNWERLESEVRLWYGEYARWVNYFPNHISL